MKSVFSFISRRAMFIMVLVMSIAIPIMAQGSAVDSGELQKWFAQIDPIFGALTLLGGYITRIIPGLKLMSGVYRVLAFAIVAGGAFIVFGFNGNVLQLVITYVFSTSLYEVFLKPLNGKPKTTSTNSR